VESHGLRPERICRAIPHHDLAIQWDVCVEMLAWDGRWQNARSFPGMEQVFAETFARLAAAVPPDVELSWAFICAPAISTPSISSNLSTRPRW
jgi:hypothetical protein